MVLTLSPVLLAGQGKSISILPGDVVLGCQVLSSHSHWCLTVSISQGGPESVLAGGEERETLLLASLVFAKH